MSIQLILHPQNYEGQFNTISSSPTEVIVNGISFTGLDTTPNYTSSTTGDVVLDVLTSAPPIIMNSWYRFRSDISGTPSYPSVSSGSLVLNSVTTLTISGVYQKLSNLVIGQQYTITINMVTTGTGSIFTKLANGTIVYDGMSTLASNSQIIETFTAQSTTDTIIISYLNSVADSISIGDISTQPVIGAIPSGSTSILDNGQVIVDLYEDEDLPLTLSVDDFKNVAEQVQSYSKAFNLPATKRNNKIFNQIFDVTRSNDGLIFNPYKKTQCVLKQDGFILFEGYLRLLDVSDKLGETSYNVNLYSEVIALADFLKDRAFRDLDFTELTHDYDYSNIRNTWVNNNIFTNPSTSGFRSTTTVKYPFVNWDNQIGFTSGNMPKLFNLETAFRPFINIRYIIDRIFEATPFTYESSFFNTTDFKKLYMDFNWGTDNVPTLTGVNTSYSSIDPLGVLPIATTTYTPLVLNAWSVANIPMSTFPPNYNQTTNIITTTALNEQYNVQYDYYVRNTSASPVDVECRWLYNSTTEINYSGIQTIAAGGIFAYQGNFNQIIPNVGGTLEAQFKASAGSSIEQYGHIYSTFNWADTIFNVNVLAITTNTFLQTLRGETGQWDFLKGLITMFNLVTLPDEDNPNNIKIEPYSDVFITPSLTIPPLDWTDKIDVSEMKLTPLTDLNKRTIFKFVEDEDDYAFTQYKNLVGGHLYGSKKYNAGNEFNILEGLDEIVAEPFAATVVKPLFSNYPSFITPAIYSYNAEDQTSEGFDNSPRIMYDNGKKTLSGTTYSVPAQNGVLGSAFENEYLQFSHIKDGGLSISATRDFHFGECQLLTNTAPTVNNLFNLYWLPYYNELYNPDTRIMTIKVNLTPADISEFKFNDTVFIKNRVFRVNKIDYKPNDLATVEFILIP